MPTIITNCPTRCIGSKFPDKLNFYILKYKYTSLITDLDLGHTCFWGQPAHPQSALLQMSKKVGSGLPLEPFLIFLCRCTSPSKSHDLEHGREMRTTIQD